MSYAYYIDEERSVAIIRPEGRFNETEFMDALRTVYGHPKRTPDFAHVWDTRFIEELTMDTDVLPMYKSFIQETQDRAKDSRVAILASRSTVRLFSSMLMEITDLTAPRSMQLFQTEEELADWLNVPRDELWDIPEEAWTKSSPPADH